jgi:hypothetical protein
VARDIGARRLNRPYITRIFPGTFVLCGADPGSLSIGIAQISKFIADLRAAPEAV